MEPEHVAWAKVNCMLVMQKADSSCRATKASRVNGQQAISGLPARC